MQHYNVHSHTFTMSNAPEKFLSLYLPPAVASLLAKVTNTAPGAATVEKLLSVFGGNGGKRYASFLKTGKSKNQMEVFEALLKQYDDDTAMQFVVLSLYMEKTGAGPSASGYEGQLEELMQVKKQYPDRLLLFMGIDPRWKSTGQELQKTVAAYFNTKLSITKERSVYPFIGLKLYPPMGFYPFDERLMETLEWAAENEVPVLSHCSYLGGIYNNDSDYINSILASPNPYNNGQLHPAQFFSKKNVLKWLIGRQNPDNNLNACSYFMEPAAYDAILAHFSKQRKPLKLCLAHFGGGNQMLDSISSKKKEDPFGVAKQNWFTQIEDRMKEYEGLYTDISYTLHDPKTHSIIFQQLANTAYGNRIMFGTDYFLTERELPEKLNYSTFKNVALAKPATGTSTNAWDAISATNVLSFLLSKYYNGKVI